MSIRIEHPKHGFHNVMSESDVAEHAKRGWSKWFPPVEPELSRDDVIAAYVEKFGKKPHRLMKPENIQKAIDDNS